MLTTVLFFAETMTSTQREVKSFIMSQKFSVLFFWTFYSSENTEKMYYSFYKNIKQQIFSTLKIITIINNRAPIITEHQIGILKLFSDGSHDNEIMAADNSALPSWK